MVESSATDVQRMQIRKSHPALYRTLMALGLMSIALAGNFWFSKPAFNPYGIPKELIGVVFFLIGLSLIVFLNLFHDLRWVRLTLAFSIGFMCFWGISNTQQFFAGNTSLQLPILYVALSIMQIPLLIESPINTMTEKR